MTSTKKIYTPPTIIHYEKVNNFGDRLNTEFWARLFHQIDVNASQPAILGVGTILNDRHFGLIESNGCLIAGSGYGYDGITKISDRTRLAFVRGPRTCEALRISPKYFAGDPAYLADEVIGFERSASQLGVAFLPHFESEYLFRWNWVCRFCSVKYISPSESFQSVLQRISAASLLVTESLHGAILADSLRIPWIAVKTREEINEFKWNDFFCSLGMQVELVPLPPPKPGRKAMFKPQSLLRSKANLLRIAKGRPNLSKDCESLGMKDRLRSRFDSIKEAYRTDEFLKFPKLVDCVN